MPSSGKPSPTESCARFDPLQELVTLVLVGLDTAPDGAVHAARALSELLGGNDFAEKDIRDEFVRCILTSPRFEVLFQITILTKDQGISMNLRQDRNLMKTHSFQIQMSLNNICEDFSLP